MAVDTQEKRMSASGAGRPYMRGKLPGTNDQAWRVASGHGYNGNVVMTLADVISLEDLQVVLPRLASVSVGYPGLGSLVVNIPTLKSVEVQPG